jgi:hypothetical protein
MFLAEGVRGWLPAWLVPSFTFGSEQAPSAFPASASTVPVTLKINNAAILLALSS